MSELGFEQLTLFPEDSHVNHSLKPDSEEARRMTVTSGLKCCELSKTCGPLGFLEKMLLTSSIWRSMMCFLTWKPQATPQGRLWFQLAASALCIKDTELQSWPTPTAMDSKGLSKHYRKDTNGTRSMLLSQKVNYLSGMDGQLNPRWVEWLMGFPIGWTELEASFRYIKLIEEAKRQWKMNGEEWK